MYTIAQILNFNDSQIKELCDSHFITFEFIFKNKKLLSKIPLNYVKLESQNDFFQLYEINRVLKPPKSIYSNVNFPQTTTKFVQKLLDDNLIHKNLKMFINKKYIKDFNETFFLKNYKKILTSDNGDLTHYKKYAGDDCILSYKFIDKHKKLIPHIYFDNLQILDEKDFKIALKYYKLGKSKHYPLIGFLKENFTHYFLDKYIKVLLNDCRHYEYPWNLFTKEMLYRYKKIFKKEHWSRLITQNNNVDLYLFKTYCDIIDFPYWINSQKISNLLNYNRYNMIDLINLITKYTNIQFINQCYITKTATSTTTHYRYKLEFKDNIILYKPTYVQSEFAKIIKNGYDDKNYYKHSLQALIIYIIKNNNFNYNLYDRKEKYVLRKHFNIYPNIYKDSKCLNKKDRLFLLNILNHYDVHSNCNFDKMYMNYKSKHKRNIIKYYKLLAQIYKKNLYVDSHNNIIKCK
jgi:hypothetical protein